jgi:S-formylglutathione hydrolase
VTWHQELIGGKKARFYEPRPRRASFLFAILYLHGIEEETLEGKSAFTAVFDELNLPCICPWGAQCWWVDRPCDQFDFEQTPQGHLLANVLPFYQSRLGIASRAIGLLGISMGGQGALRLAFQYPNLFPAVAAIAPALDYHELYGQGSALDTMYDSKEQARQDTAIMHVPPHDYPPYIFFASDPDDRNWHRGSDRLHEKLSALGIPHTCDLSTRAGGHSWAYFDAMAERAIRFLNDGLEQESRRLL